MHLTKYTGRILGAHQKIDRTAWRQLMRLGVGNKFPSSREILKFEGKNGPDGIKVKSPAKDEPWHYYSPFDEKDRHLLDIIDEHYQRLIKEIRLGNRERSAFEAAWLAHAIVDGLTPAHHFPYEQTLVELRGGQGIETRTTYREKLIMPGKTVVEKLGNNWKMWGAGGLFATHALFEMGVATLILPLRFGDMFINDSDIEEAKELGVVALFERVAKEIGVLEMYEAFAKTGWTSKMAYDVRHKLAPQMVRMVTLAWYLAASEARLVDAGVEV